MPSAIEQRHDIVGQHVGAGLVRGPGVGLPLSPKPRKSGAISRKRSDSRSNIGSQVAQNSGQPCSKEQRRAAAGLRDMGREAARLDESVPDRRHEAPPWLSLLHHHLDQRRAVGPGQRLVERGVEACRRVDALGGEAEAFGDLGDVHRRIVEVHADRRVVAVEQLQAVLEDLVALVVGDHEDHRQLLVGGTPQRRDRVHGAAVADHGHDAALGLGDLDADGRGDAPADAAAHIAEEAVAVAEGEVVRQGHRAGQAFLDDDGVLRAASR